MVADSPNKAISLLLFIPSFFLHMVYKLYGFFVIPCMTLGQLSAKAPVASQDFKGSSPQSQLPTVNLLIYPDSKSISCIRMYIPRTNTESIKVGISNKVC